jgi:hypothetical protein
MTSSTIHFDSIYSQYVQPYNDPYNARFFLMTPLRSPKMFQLKSIELPVNFYNIRNSGTLNKLILTTNLGNTYTATIPAGNYADIASLLTAVNTQVSSIIPNTTVTFSLSGHKINVSATSTAITTLKIQNTTLSNYVLGFRNATFTGLSTTGPVDYLLNTDNYINMYLYNISSDNTSSGGNLYCSFKIPLNAEYDLVYFSAENTSFRQYLSTSNSNQDIPSLQVIMYDRFGEMILNNNVDYSFTLEVSY